MESFIDTVHKYPCLWNTDCSDYSHPELKKSAWHYISKKYYFQDDTTAKSVWNKLVNQYKQSQRHLKTKDTSGKPWKYENHMEFMRPYLKSQKDRDNKKKRYSGNYGKENLTHQSSFLKLNDNSNVEIEVPAYWEEINTEVEQALKNKRMPETNQEASVEIQIENSLDEKKNVDDKIISIHDSTLQPVSQSTLDCATTDNQNIDNNYNYDTYLNITKTKDVATEMFSCRNTPNHCLMEQEIQQESQMKNFFDCVVGMCNSLPDNLKLKVQRGIFNVVMDAKEDSIMNMS